MPSEYSQYLNDLPDFTAEEINKLSELSRKIGKTGEYYKKCHSVVINYLDNKINDLNKVRKWLWLIKNDLKEIKD